MAATAAGNDAPARRNAIPFRIAGDAALHAEQR
jgi:hypothetical protein